MKRDFLAVVCCVIFAGQAHGQSREHKYYEHFGAWTLISNINLVTAIEDFWMATSAIGKPGILSLDCKKADDRYAFVLGDKDLSYLPYAQRVVLDARASNEKPFKVAAGASGNGNIVIDEIEHQSSFSALLATILFIRPTPKAIGFALGPNQWLFSLEGFEPVANKLGERCGFTPDPERARRRSAH